MTQAQKILIVDDEVIIALELSDILDGLGYDIVGMAATGKRAIALAETTRPALALMDVHLRGTMDGPTASAIIHERFGVRSLLVTAHATGADLERRTDAGIYGLIRKPFRAATIERAVADALATP